MARSAARRWQGWAVNTRTNAEVEDFHAARRKRDAAQAAKQREELGRSAAPLILETLPLHTGWLTLEDVCVFAGIAREKADAGCDLLAASGDLQRDSAWIEAVQQDVPLVRRANAGTCDSDPLRSWLEGVIVRRFRGDVAEAAARLRANEAFLRRVLGDNCGRILFEGADWLFVQAGEPHQLQILYPVDEDAADFPHGATA